MYKHLFPNNRNCRPVQVYAVSMRHAMLSSNAACMPFNRVLFPSPNLLPFSHPHQKPGGLILWLTLVHFGNSISTTSQPLHYHPCYPMSLKISPTMNAFPIPLLLPIKHCIFILRSHLRLRWHLLFPPLQLRCRLHVVFLEGVVNSGDYIVNKTKAFALAALLGGGKTPGYFPVRVRLLVGVKRQWGRNEEPKTEIYQRRPPERGEVVLKAPNMILTIVEIDMLMGLRELQKLLAKVVRK